MPQQTLPAKHIGANTILKYIGLTILLLALVGTLLDLFDWRIRRPTTDLSSYAFTGNRVVFSTIANGSINVTAGPEGKVTIVRRLTEGICKLRVNEQTRGNTLVVQDSGGCNSGIPHAVFGGSMSEYQVQVPVNTTIIAQTSTASISVAGVNGNHWLRTDRGSIAVRNADTQSISASTHSGSVTLQLLGSPSEVVAHSDSGEVAVRLQNTTTAYKTTATSNGGKVSVGIKTNSQNIRNVITASSGTGNVTLAY